MFTLYQWQILNYLLQYKSTQKSLTDLFYLLNSERLTLYRYYLIKQQKMDENNNPYFVYKEDGTLDKKAMYDFYFQLVESRNKFYDKVPLIVKEYMDIIKV